MNNSQREIANRIDAMPIDKARSAIASGTFGDIGSDNHAFAVSWLLAREENLRNSNRQLSYGKAMNSASVDIWTEIEREFGVSKRLFGKKINFVRDAFRRKIIFRDLEQAFVLASNGFNKSSVVLAGGVVEELLRLYLDHRRIRPTNNRLETYIRTCNENGFLKAAIERLADSVRHFRNVVHLERESSARHTISKATAKGAVSSVFTIVNEFDI